MKKESNSLQSLRSILEDLGLTEVESRVYLATVESGNGTASQIAKTAGLQRVTAYEVLKRLSKIDFVRIRVRAGSQVKYFIPIGLQEIKSKLEDRKKNIDKGLESVPALSQLFNSLHKARGANKPEVLYFEGVQGVMTAMFDTLEQKPNEIISFSSHKWLESVFSEKFLSEYWNKRVKYKIRTRGIIPHIKEAVLYFNYEKNKKELREVRSLPKESFNFENEIDVYGDNVCIVSLESGKEHAVIIRSKSIAKSFEDIFEILWLGAGRYY